MRAALMATMTGPLFRFGLLVAVVTIACTAPPNFGAATSTSTSETHARKNAPEKPAPEPIIFKVQEKTLTVNCKPKTILTVNGMFPGPTIKANEGDRVIVDVINESANESTTIHFHGVRQWKSPWMDGVAGVTMCPIKNGSSFRHDFVIPRQQGTLLWHGHYGVQRATLHGAFITLPTVHWRKKALPGIPVYPVKGTSNDSRFPFPEPEGEHLIILGEWFNENVTDLEHKLARSGGILKTADALTINGKPGALYNCRMEGDIEVFRVKSGKTYLLRIINAGADLNLFFGVEGHKLKVVEADAEYVQSFDRDVVYVAPGQTLGVLLSADKEGGGTYYMAATNHGKRQMTPAKPTARLVYETTRETTGALSETTVDVDVDVKKKVDKIKFPEPNDSQYVMDFTSALKHLYPGRVPCNVTRDIFMTVGYSYRPCADNPDATCIPKDRIRAEVNNITFKEPDTAKYKMSMLEASYGASYLNKAVDKDFFTEDFPMQPDRKFDYTGIPAANHSISKYATRVIPIEFNEIVQIVLQNTNISNTIENHPFHLHGHNFWEVGQGFGNYNATVHAGTFNLYNPALRNTVPVPIGGWAAIRWKANNPGMWLFHCHLDKHSVMGMQTVFHVKNRGGEECGGEYSYECPRPKVDVDACE